ncbi:MAG: S41 family peptidase [Defluviitaleaceae bacterium]|nr:S41 family peptidase [Defluviitaleaceae bacterium]
MKKIFTGFLAIVMMFGFTGFTANAAPTDDPLMIPLRAVFEAVGAIVEWDPDAATIHIYTEYGDIVIFTKEPVAIIHGHPIWMYYGISLWEGTSFIDFDDLILLEHALIYENLLIATLSAEARDLALADFDFLIDLILDNSPWDSVAYRALGLDFHEMAYILRYLIYHKIPLEFPIIPGLFQIHRGMDARSAAANYLAHLLLFNMAIPLEGIGHLQPRDLTMYRLQKTSIMRSLADEYASYDYMLQLFYQVWTHPMAVWFYGEYIVDVDSEESPFPEIPGNVTTEIITPGSVASMRIRSFMGCGDFDDLTILPFLNEIADFDHLIIDLRGNGGGLASYFNERIARRLISEPLLFSGYQFFAGGEIATKWMNAVLDTVLLNKDYSDSLDIIYFEFLPAAYFIEREGMAYFNPDDLARLAYVAVERAYLLPSEDSVGFNGKIWMLVDGNSASATASAAAMSIATGFATVVGENTSGVMGPIMSYAVLPNTGIIWRTDIGYFADSTGRSQEVYGITPQIRNRPTLDARATVLAIIAETN